MLARTLLGDASTGTRGAVPAHWIRLFVSRACLINAVLAGASLDGMDLSGRDLRGVDLDGADLSGAKLTGADLADARNWTSASFAGADVTGVNNFELLTWAVGYGARDADRAKLEPAPAPSPIKPRKKKLEPTKSKSFVLDATVPHVVRHPLLDGLDVKPQGKDCKFVISGEQTAVSLKFYVRCRCGADQDASRYLAVAARDGSDAVRNVQAALDDVRCP